LEDQIGIGRQDRPPRECSGEGRRPRVLRTTVAANGMTDIGARKVDHLDLATRGDVGFRSTTTLLECVKLVHDAVPELAYDEIDASLTLFGKRLTAPILIAAMTGGTERARRINRELAAIAEERGYAFGLGSQRALHKDPGSLPTYDVRDVAPQALVFGNIGVVQATASSSAELRELIDSVGADALCVHLNPAMELVQPSGDRDFRGGLDAIARLVAELGRPVIVKETGCGIGPNAAMKLRAAGAAHVDVSGAGGTSWVAVETARAEGLAKSVGETFRDWGVPTAASVVFSARAGFETIFATGGVSTGLQVAQAIALGASAAGIARASLQALENGGRDAALAFFDRVEAELRTAMLLVGARNLSELARAPRLLVGELPLWLSSF
jgi:isopentenyl-diphosphate delta-isomerase